MASEVEICNIGLAQVRAGSINSLDESSVAAQQCKLFYPIARDQVLKDTDWGFNHAIKALVQLSSVDIFNWAYAWQYPSDCLKINNVLRNIEEVQTGTGSVVSSRLYDHRFQRPQDLPRVEFRIFNSDGVKVIATNEAECRIDYMMKVTDVNFFDANLQMAIGYLVGVYVAVSLAGEKAGRQFRTDCLALHNAFLQRASTDNANEQYTEPDESEFITVRE